MKLFKKAKKAFTLVELVVVIAVIAILAAVSVGVYFGVTAQAEFAQSTSIIKQMNDMLTIGEVLEGKNITFHEARKDMTEQGIDVVKLKDITDHRYAWNKETDRMLLLDKDNNIVYPSDQSKPKNLCDIFVIAKEGKSLDTTFSNYLADNYSTSAIVTSTGLDAGNVELEKLTFATEESKSVTINNRFLKTEVVINAKNSNVEHYGFAKIVDIQKVALNSYHEHGTVAKMNIQDGRVVAESLSEIFAVNKGSNGILENTSGSIVHNPDVNSQTCASDHCGATLIPDAKYVYNICEGCGGYVDFPDFNTEIGADIGYVSKEFPDYNSTCEHDWGENDGKVFKCEKCGFSFTKYVDDHTWVVEYLTDDEGNTKTIYHCEDEGCEYHKDNNTDLEKPKVYSSTFNLTLEHMGVEETGEHEDGFHLFDMSQWNPNDLPHIKKMDQGFRFQSIYTGYENESVTDTNKYNDWIADFYCAIDKPVDPLNVPGYEGLYGVGLWCNFRNWNDKTFANFFCECGYGFFVPGYDTMPSYTYVGVLQNGTPLSFTYSDICEYIGTFECATFALRDENGYLVDEQIEDLTLFIELRLTNPNSEDSDNPEYVVIATESHTFKNPEPKN